MTTLHICFVLVLTLMHVHIIYSIPPSDSEPVSTTTVPNPADYKFVLKPGYGSGIGSYLVCSFTGFIAAHSVQQPLLLDESGFFIFRRGKSFWSKYFLPVMEEKEIISNIDYHYHDFYTPIDSLEKAKEVNLFCKPNALHHIKYELLLTPDSVAQLMKRFWLPNELTFNAMNEKLRTLKQLAATSASTASEEDVRSSDSNDERLDELYLLFEHPFVTVALRGGDKIASPSTECPTCEGAEPPDIAAMANKVKDFYARTKTARTSASISGINNNGGGDSFVKSESESESVRSMPKLIHLVTDSYLLADQLRTLLPSPEYRFITSSPQVVGRSDRGFFMKDMALLNDIEIESEVIHTLLNYEISRRAQHVVVSSKTNIGVWIALLRVMDGLSYQFAENLDEFPYFGPRALSVEHFGEQPSI